MSKILFILFNGSGRILPAMGVIRALRESNQEVGLVTVPGEFRPSEHLLPQMKALGVRMFESPTPPPDIHPGAIYPGMAAEEMAMMMRGEKELVDTRRLRQIRPVLSQIEPLRAIISEYEPDLVMADTLAYQAGIAAHLEQRPYLGYTASLRMVAPPSFGYEPEARTLAPEAKEIFAQFGMAPRFASLEYLSPRLNLVFALPEFAGTDGPNAELVRLVGPPTMTGRGDQVDFPWDALKTDRPVVFISCGSVLRWQPDIIDVVSEATAPLGVQCVVSAGELAGKKTFLPHVLAVSYAPQLELLKRVSVFATVGGANSVNEALCAGVPMLMMPMLSDQHLQGYFIEKAGVGLSISSAEGTVESYRAAFKRLLDESQGFKARSRVLQGTYSSTNGGRVAADAIMSYASQLTTA